MMRKTSIQLAIMLGLSLLLGGLTRFNLNETSSFSTDPSLPSAQIYQVEDLMEVLNSAIIIDVRLKSFYEHGHILGAINLPHDQVEDFPSDFTVSLKRASDSGEKIIVYCAGEHCHDAEKIQMALAREGLKVGIYTAGWDEWSQLGLPTE